MKVMVTGPDAFGAVADPHPAANTPTNVDAMTNAVVFLVGILITFLSIVKSVEFGTLFEPLVTDSGYVVGIEAFATR